MLKKDFLENIKWLAVVFVIKLTLFVFFTIQFNTYFPSQFIVKKTFVELGETLTYYGPIESLADGKGYSTKINGARFPERTSAIITSKYSTGIIAAQNLL